MVTESASAVTAVRVLVGLIAVATALRHVSRPVARLVAAWFPVALPVVFSVVILIQSINAFEMPG